jgi:hypothetical protein
LDVLASSRSDATIAWYENTGQPAPDKFMRHLVTDHESMVMGIHPADVDGDNALDLLIASTNSGKVGWWSNRRAPWQISGVDMAPAAMNAGQEEVILQLVSTHTGQLGDFAHQIDSLAFRLEDAAGQPLSATAVSGILADVSLYLDDGSGVYEVGNDPWVGTAVLSNTVAGQFTITFAPDDPLGYLAPSQNRRYFVIATLSNSAHQQPWRDFRLIHLWQASQVHYPDYDNASPLLLGSDTPTGIIHIQTPDGWEVELYLPLILNPTP